MRRWPASVRLLSSLLVFGFLMHLLASAYIDKGMFAEAVKEARQAREFAGEQTILSCLRRLRSGEVGQT